MSLVIALQLSQLLTSYFQQLGYSIFRVLLFAAVLIIYRLGFMIA